MKFCIKTLGCKVNSYESEFVKDLFLKKGFSYDEENFDVCIVNTCTVTNNSDKKSKKTINSIRKNYPKAIIIAMGCSCEFLKDRTDEVHADIIIGNRNKSKVIEYLEEFLLNKEKIVRISEQSLEFEDMEISKFSNRTRAFVKIEDGCNNFCSYCIIPYVRGRVRSKEFNSVIEEVKRLVSNGHKEIVLTGIHTGQYGKGLEGDITLAKLLTELEKIDGLLRIRLSSIEITEVNDEVLEVFKNSKKLVNHFHVPLQCGSEEILKSMNRKYNKQYFLDKVNQIRNIDPDVSISTDLIVGFPGETEEMFNESYEFCKLINFSKIHVFPYSDRTGTVASKMMNKVPEEVKHERALKMIELSEKLESDYYNKFIGREVEVLFEEYKDGYYIGHTPNYLKVCVKEEQELNKISKIILK